MRWRLWKQELAIRRAGGVDILLTHAPPRGYGDREDYAHRGFEAFLPFLDRHKPAYLVHGHVHMNYGHNIPRAVKRGDTTIINAWSGTFWSCSAPAAPEVSRAIFRRMVYDTKCETQPTNLRRSLL